MKRILHLAFILLIIGCSNSTELKHSNEDYNYSFLINNISDSLNQQSSNTKDSLLFQFGEGFNNDTLRIVSNGEYYETILKSEISTGHGGSVKLPGRTTEVKLNFNNGPIILISILKKRIYFFKKDNNNIEVIGLVQPAKFR